MVLEDLSFFWLGRTLVIVPRLGRFLLHGVPVGVRGRGHEEVGRGAVDPYTPESMRAVVVLHRISERGRHCLTGCEIACCAKYMFFQIQCARKGAGT